MTPRIAPVTPANAPLLTRLLYRYATRRFGAVPEPFAVCGNRMKARRHYSRKS